MTFGRAIKDWRGLSLRAGPKMCRMCATLAMLYPQLAHTKARRAPADTNLESHVPLITLWRRCNLEPATVSLGSRRSIENREHSVYGYLVLAIEITGIPQSMLFTTQMEQKRSRRPPEDGIRQRLFRARSTPFCGGGEEWRRRDFCFGRTLAIASGRITAKTMSA